MSNAVVTPRRSAHSTRRALLILALGAAVSSCAPDSMTNRQATGFNGYLKTIGEVCYPLLIGSSSVGEWLRNLASSDPNYSYFLDMTSRLYYGKISQDEYRTGLTGFLGYGSTNDASFRCMFRNLPADRPSAPPA